MARDMQLKWRSRLLVSFHSTGIGLGGTAMAGKGCIHISKASSRTGQ
jgi:hypothetical protein